MAVLTPEQIMGLVKQYGFADPITATAVVLGESGGNTQAENRGNSDGSIDRGLWQINSVHAKSERNPDGLTVAEMFDLDASTRYALRLSSGGTDYNPWAATRSRNFGAHRATAERVKDAPPMLVRDREEATQTGGEQISEAAGRVADVVAGPLAGAGDVLAFLGKGLAVLVSPDFWKRAGYGLAGLVLVYLGVLAIFGRSALALGTTVASKGAVSLPDSPTQML